MIKVHLSHYIYDKLVHKTTNILKGTWTQKSPFQGKNFNENGDGNLTFCQIPAPLLIEIGTLKGIFRGWVPFNMFVVIIYI